MSGLEAPRSTAPSLARRIVRGAAWFAIVASFPVWGAAFLVVPFLPIAAGQRAIAATACIVAGEVLFWSAGLVLGAEVMARFRTPKVRTGASFRGLRVAVLGATGGLGEAVARAVVREGGEALLVGRDPARLASLANELGERASPVVVEDLTPEALRAAALTCGSVHHVVCATGVDVRRSLAAHTDDDVARQLAVALAGPVHVARAFLPTLRDGGSIALFGGFADGGLALPYYTVDVAARAGLAGFCAAVNHELAVESRDARLCYVCPAPADTASERPFAALWATMGTKLVAPSSVADFVLAALLSKKTVAVQGASARLAAYAQRVAPDATAWLVRRRFGPLLRARFGDALASEGAEPPRAP
jgi:NADP-dependent 3-hydroxy acid dehydrogenase YdfG